MAFLSRLAIHIITVRHQHQRLYRSSDVFSRVSTLKMPSPLGRRVGALRRFIGLLLVVGRRYGVSSGASEHRIDYRFDKSGPSLLPVVEDLLGSHHI